MDKLNIGNICGGALPELFDRALAEIVENIKDVNTSVDKKREMVIKITVQPYVDRSGAQITATCESKLSGVAAVSGTMFVSQKPNHLEAYTSDPRQNQLFMEEKPASETPS